MLTLYKLDSDFTICLVGRVRSAKLGQEAVWCSAVCLTRLRYYFYTKAPEKKMKKAIESLYKKKQKQSSPWPAVAALARGCGVPVAVAGAHPYGGGARRWSGGAGRCPGGGKQASRRGGGKGRRREVARRRSGRRREAARRRSGRHCARAGAQVGLDRERSRGEMKGQACDPCWISARCGARGDIFGRAQPCPGAKLDFSFFTGQG